MINLFEQFDLNTKKLYESLKLAGHNHFTIVTDDDGFLPDDINTPYKFFADYYASNSNNSMFFNEVSIPRYWEIEGNNETAWIKDMGVKRGQIVYRNNYKSRIVSQVEWLDKEGRVRFIDHYTKHGVHYAQTVLDIEGKFILKKYIDQNGKEVMYENYVTKDIVLEWKGKNYFFDSKVKFIQFYIEKLNLDLNNFIINSLSTPFAVLYNMKTHGKDVLFWQEHCNGNIPGNMELMFESHPYRQFKMVIPELNEYETILENIDKEERTNILNGGYLHYYYSINQYTNNVLTLTNSDQIEHIESIVNKCPNLTFHIAAVTEMSTKLMKLDQHSNVKLFPVVDNETVKSLFDKCDVYLDINDGNEILNSVNRAFEHDMLIMGYEEVSHNKTKTYSKLLFTKDNQAKDLIKVLKGIYRNQKQFKKYLSKQKSHANEISKTKFNDILESALK